MPHGLRETLSSVGRFLRHPFEEIARLPSWKWQQALILQWSGAVLAGLIAGLFPFSLWKIIQGTILFPVILSLMAALMGAFLYYYFQIFENRMVPFHRLFHLVVIANLPFLASHALATWFSFFHVLGLGAMALLLIVGLTENFGVEKMRSVKLILLIFGLLFSLWVAEKVIWSPTVH